jgi:hypothetical protein
MIRITDKDTGADLGKISDEELQFLQGQMEEESMEDTDYYISKAMLAVLKDQGADRELVRILTDAIGSGDGVEIAWAEE